MSPTPFYGPVTLEEYYGGHDRTSAAIELSDLHRASATTTVARVNTLLARFGQERRLNSGWRPSGYNAKVPGAAVKSKHILCQAADVADPDGDLDHWLFTDWEKCKAEGREGDCILAQLGLWLEHPLSTKGWTHVQITPPLSGNRVFFP